MAGHKYPLLFRLVTVLLLTEDGLSQIVRIPSCSDWLGLLQVVSIPSCSDWLQCYYWQRMDYHRS